MAEYKGLDVSSYQGYPDWKRFNLDFAILRVTERYGTDSSFEHNYAGCQKYNIPVGAYKFSYALTIDQIKEETQLVVNVLHGRKLDLPIFLDLEWDEQRRLTKAKLMALIEAFREIIVKAGYQFGIYCNMDWYNNVLPSDAKKYDLWLASYPLNDTGVIKESLRPSVGVAWQYSSKGHVPGFDGNIDMDVLYKKYWSDDKDTVVITPEGITADDVIDLAEQYIGCNEADGSHRQIIDGYNAHTPRARGYVVQYWDSWCDTFVSFIFIKLDAVDLIGGTECGVEEHVKLFKKAGIWIEDGTITPQRCDIIVYNWDQSSQPNDGYADHIGFVEFVGGGKIVTIEGNYNNAVQRRVLNVGNGNIRGYARPRYGKASVRPVQDGKDTQPTNSIPTPTNTLESPSKTPKWVGKATCNGLNVRTWAGIENPNIKSYPILNYGNLVDVCDTVEDKDGFDWYYIRIAGKWYGFVHSAYITKA